MNGEMETVEVLWYEKKEGRSGLGKDDHQKEPTKLYAQVKSISEFKKPADYYKAVGEAIAKEMDKVQRGRLLD